MLATGVAGGREDTQLLVGQEIYARVSVVPNNQYTLLHKVQPQLF